MVILKGAPLGESGQAGADPFGDPRKANANAGDQKVFRMSRLPIAWICIGALLTSSVGAKPAGKHHPERTAASADTAALSSHSDSTLVSPAAKSAGAGGGMVLHHSASKVPYLIGAGAGAAAIGAGALLHSKSHSSPSVRSQTTISTIGSPQPPTPPGGTDPPTQQDPPQDPGPMIGTGGSQAPTNPPQAPEPDTLPLLCIALAAWACYSALKK